MSTTTSTLKPKMGFFTRIFTKILDNYLPPKFKRLIYVSSILGLIQQMQDPDMALVKKLNDTLKLAHFPDAYAFPMYIKSVIWRGAMFDQVCLHTNETVPIGELMKQDLNSKDCTAIGEYFASQTPEWLKYASIEVMVNDVVRLIKQLRQFSGQTHTHVMA